MTHPFRRSGRHLTLPSLFKGREQTIFSFPLRRKATNYLFLPPQEEGNELSFPSPSGGRQRTIFSFPLRGKVRMGVGF